MRGDDRRAVQRSRTARSPCLPECLQQSRPPQRSDHSVRISSRVLGMCFACTRHIGSFDDHAQHLHGSVINVHKRRDVLLATKRCGQPSSLEDAASNDSSGCCKCKVQKRRSSRVRLQYPGMKRPGFATTERCLVRPRDVECYL
nr:hypothetical protein CFP56_71098 [Quercus suber]